MLLEARGANLSRCSRTLSSPVKKEDVENLRHRGKEKLWVRRRRGGVKGQRRRPDASLLTLPPRFSIFWRNHVPVIILRSVGRATKRRVGKGVIFWSGLPWPEEDEEEDDLADVVEDGLRVVAVVVVAMGAQDAVWFVPAKPTHLCWLSLGTSMRSA